MRSSRGFGDLSVTGTQQNSILGLSVRHGLWACKSESIVHTVARPGYVHIGGAA